MADPVTGLPEEERELLLEPPGPALRLLRRHDFRNLFLAISATLVLLVSAAQADVPDAVLGRVVGLISLVHRGAHATGLIFIAPLFAVVAPQDVFAGAAIGLALVGVAGTVAALIATRRAV